jgi:hypothetical protein
MLSRKTWLMALLSTTLVGVALTQSSAAPAIGERPGKFDPDKWLLPNSQMVMTINFRQMFDAAALKKGGGVAELRKKLDENKEAVAALKSAGIDPFKDIDAVVISASGKDAKDAKALIVVRGTFNHEKIHDAALAIAKDHADKLAVSKVGEVRIYEVATKDKKFYGAFADRNSFVFTLSKADTIAALKTAGRGPVMVNKQLAPALAKFSGKESMTMGMVVTDELKDQLRKLPQAAEVAPKLLTLTATLTLTADVAMNVEINTEDAAAATKMGQLLTQAKSLVELMVLNNPDVPPVVEDVLNALKIAAVRNTVEVKLRVTAEMIDKAGKKE